jgi:hypothetical protein
MNGVMWVLSYDDSEEEQMRYIRKTVNYVEWRLLGCCAMWLLSEELSASIIRVTRVGELGTLAITSNRHMLRRNDGGAKFL